jgi:hypothetical protein
MKFDFEIDQDGNTKGTFGIQVREVPQALISSIDQTAQAIQKFGGFSAERRIQTNDDGSTTELYRITFIKGLSPYGYSNYFYQSFDLSFDTCFLRFAFEDKKMKLPTPLTLTVKDQSSKQNPELKSEVTIDQKENLNNALLKVKKKV